MSSKGECSLSCHTQQADTGRNGWHVHSCLSKQTYHCTFGEKKNRYDWLKYLKNASSTTWTWNSNWWCSSKYMKKNLYPKAPFASNVEWYTPNLDIIWKKPPKKKRKEKNSNCFLEEFCPRILKEKLKQ